MSSDSVSTSAAESPSAVEAAGSRRYANYVLGLLFVAYVFNFMDRQLLTILLEPIKHDLGVSDTAMGFLTGFAFAVFYTVAGIPIARWADRGSRRNIIALGIAVWSLMTAASGLARTFVHLALCRVGVGVGEAALSPPAHSLLSDYFPPERRASALGLYSMGIYIGAGLGLAAGGWITDNFGWRQAFFVVGLPGLAIALLVRWTIREPPREAVAAGVLNAESGAVAALLANRTFVYVTLAAAFHSLSGYGFGIWAPAFLARVHGLSLTRVGAIIGAITLFSALGTFLGGFITDRLARRDRRWFLWLPAVATLVGLPFIFPFLLLDNLPLAIAFYAPAALMGAMYLGPTFAFVQLLVAPHRRSLAAAVLLFVTNLIGLGLGPQLVGVLNDLLAPRLGVEAIRYSLLFLGIANLVAIAFYLLAARSLREQGLASDRVLETSE